MRVLYTGSRYADIRQPDQRQVIWQALREVEERHGQFVAIVLVHGAADGGDLIARQSAVFLGWATEAHPADWHGPCRDTCLIGHRKPGKRKADPDYCPAAGNYRNQVMVDLGADLCIATPGRFSKGTWDCVRRAKAAGIPVIVRALPYHAPKTVAL